MRNIRTLAMGLMAIMLAVSSGCGISRLWKDKKAPADKKKTEKADKKEISKAELKLKLKLKEKSIEEKKLESKNLDKALKLYKQQRKGQQANAREQNPQHPIRLADYRQVPGMLKNLKGPTPKKRAVAISRLDQSELLITKCALVRNGNPSENPTDSREGTLIGRDTISKRCFDICSGNFRQVSCKVLGSYQAPAALKPEELPTQLKLGGTFVDVKKNLEIFQVPKMMVYGGFRYVSTGYSGRSKATKRSHRRGHKGRYATREYVDRKVGALEKKHDADMAEVRRQQKFFGAEIDKIKDNLGPKTPKGLTRPLKSS